MAAAAGTATDGGEGGATSGASSGSTGSTTRGAASARLRESCWKGARALGGHEPSGGADSRAAAHLRGERGGGRAPVGERSAEHAREPAVDRLGRGGDALGAARARAREGAQQSEQRALLAADPRERNRVARTRRPRGGERSRGTARGFAVDEPRYERVAGGRGRLAREQPKERRDRRERRFAGVVVVGRVVAVGRSGIVGRVAVGLLAGAARLAR